MDGKKNETIINAWVRDFIKQCKREDAFLPRKKKRGVLAMMDNARLDFQYAFQNKRCSKCLQKRGRLRHSHLFSFHHVKEVIMQVMKESHWSFPWRFLGLLPSLPDTCEATDDDLWFGEVILPTDLDYLQDNGLILPHEPRTEVLNSNIETFITSSGLAFYFVRQLDRPLIVDVEQAIGDIVLDLAPSTIRHAIQPIVIQPLNVVTYMASWYFTQTLSFGAKSVAEQVWKIKGVIFTVSDLLRSGRNRYVRRK